MKKYITILCTLLITIQGFAQKDAISKYFSDYEYHEDFTVVTISGKMFRMISNIEMDNPEDKQTLDVISKLTGLKVITTEDNDGMSYFKSSLRTLSSSPFEEILSVNEDEEYIKIFIREEGKDIVELLMVMGSDHDFSLLSITGIIDLATIAKLGKSLDIDGMKNLEKIKRN